MTYAKQGTSTYDLMLAEIAIDSDDESQAVLASGSQKADAKVKEAATSGLPSKPTKLHQASETESYDGLTLSLPSKVQKPQSRLDESKGDAESAEDSDEEKETRVRQHDRHAFDGHAKASPPLFESAVGLNDLRPFVTRAPRLGAPTLRCYVERDRHGLNRFNPIYRLFLDDGKHFLLSAQKRSSSKTSNYLLSLDQTSIDRRSPLVVAKLRANWSGSTYTIFDSGLSPIKSAIDASIRQILGVVEVAYDDMGPGRLNVRIPSVHENGRGSTAWKDRELHENHANRNTLEATLDATALLLRSKRPHYDSASGGHVLDFLGRVNMPSIKNFQMQSNAHGDDTVLQFGRVSCQPPGPYRQCTCHKDTFTMDLRHPLSPTQAFAICLATLDAKVANVKAYERVATMLRKLSL